LSTLLLETITITLLGAMFPGPTTAATLTAGLRHRHAGLWVALGHGLVEMPFILLLAGGIGELIQAHRAGVTLAVGSAGGLVLVWLGVQGLRGLRGTADAAAPAPQRHPLQIGVVLTAANPYFFVWWATIGLTLIVQGVTLGAAAFGLFMATHWLVDVVCLDILSMAGYHGGNVLGGRRQKVILAACAVALMVFGCLFLCDAVKAYFSWCGSAAASGNSSA
jgi:threonine/homoserine/homoserine lactone efflux protein